MSQASIDSVQSWLSSELEQWGIDAVIYTRHILNIFLNSHYTTDLQLAKKEANIFARLPPGTNKTKPKIKYLKRSNSSTYDKIALRKKMATNCLQSATDDASGDISHNLTTLVDDLYDKLNEYNLLSDTNSSSDEGYVGKPAERRRESYHDAFPCLDKIRHSNISASEVTSVWNGLKKFGQETQNEVCPTLEQLEMHHKQLSKQEERKFYDQKKALARSGNSLVEQSNSVGIKNKKGNDSRRNFGKRRPHPFRDATKKSPTSRYKRKYPRGSSYRARERLDFDKENTNDFKPIHPKKYERPKRKTKGKSLQPVSNIRPDEKSFFNNLGTTVPHHTQSYPNWPDRTGTTYFLNTNAANQWKNPSESVEEQHISYLYSADGTDLQNTSEKICRPVSSSKWFRDPTSGCLEFEPGYKHKSSDSTSPSSVESWIFCPSPSLWDDVDDGLPDATQSRLERVYKRNVKTDVKDENTDPWRPLKPSESFEDDCVSNFLDVFPDEHVEPRHAHKISHECLLSDCPICLDTRSAKHKLHDSAYSQQNGDQSSMLPEPIGHENFNLEQTVQGSFFVNNLEKVNTSTSSRKEIWLKNSNQIANQAELDKLLGNPPVDNQRTASCWSPWSGWSSESIKFPFSSFFDSNPLDDYFSDVSCTVVEVSRLQCLVDLSVSGNISGDLNEENHRLPAMPILTDQNRETPLKEEQHFCEDELFCMSSVLQSLIDIINVSEDQVLEDGLKLNLDFRNASPDVKFYLGEDDVTMPDSTPLPSRQNSHEQSLSSRSKHDSTASNNSLAECITENDAWKTSLRINNSWQAISGIRKVDVLYSDKQVEPDDVTPLQPTSFTHFRPIHESDFDSSDVSNESYLQEALANESVEIEPLTDDYCEYSTSSLPKKPIKKCNGCAACDSKLRGIEQEIDKILFDGASAQIGPQPRCEKFRPKFRKIREDKAMQTTFEQQIRRIDSDLYKSFLLRPPKANSR